MATERTREPGSDHTDLCRCHGCGSGLVYPHEGYPVAAELFRIELHCPECDLVRRTTCDADAVAHLDREFDRSIACIADELARMERHNMEQWTLRFMRALHRDQILPEDF